MVVIKARWAAVNSKFLFLSVAEIVMSFEMFILTINEYCKCLCFLPCCLRRKIKTGEKMKNYISHFLPLKNLLSWTALKRISSCNELDERSPDDFPSKMISFILRENYSIFLYGNKNCSLTKLIWKVPAKFRC